MSVTRDAAWLGYCRLGRFRLGQGPVIYDRMPAYHIEIRSAGGGTILYSIPKNLLDGMYEDIASACGRLDIELSPNDRAWPYIQYGREVWFYRKGQLQKIYVIRGITQVRQ
jgi:hypothetical protein